MINKNKNVKFVEKIDDKFEKNKAIINEIMKKSIKEFYPKMIAESLTSVQQIEIKDSIFDKKYSLIIPENFVKVKESIKKETHFDYWCCIDNVLCANMSFHNSNTLSMNDDELWKYINKNYKKDIEFVNSICNENGLNVKFCFIDYHEFMFGWTKGLSLEITEKVSDNEN